MLIPRRWIELGTLSFLHLHGESAAQATPAPEPPRAIVQLAYRADPGCPDSGQFMAEIAGRVTRPVAWSDGPAWLALDVEARVVAEGSFKGTLMVTESAGAQSAREFLTPSCEDAITALAVVAALAIDASALPAPKPSPLPSRPKETVLRRVEEPVWQATLAPVAGISEGLAPVPLVTLGLSAAILREARASFTSRLRVAGVFARTGTSGPASEDGSFSWSVARVSLEPLRLAIGPGFALYPGLHTDAGWMWVEGPERAGIETKRVGHFSLSSGPSLELEYTAGRLYVGALGAVLANLTRRAYVLESPRAFVYQAKLAVFTAELGIGLRL